MKAKATSLIPFDISNSFAFASTFAAREFNSIRLYLVGIGGTGSWLAQYLAISVKTLLDKHPDKTVHITFVDPDIVEPQNVGRQNFCQAEIGRAKAITLAHRYSAAYGVPINALQENFTPEIVSHQRHNPYVDLTVFIGCVDNAEARIALNEALSTGYSYNNQANAIWLDCGNSGEGKLVGNVLFGTTNNTEFLSLDRRSKLCPHLPGPALQDPKLLIALPEENTTNNLSCAEIAALNSQALMINRAVAVIAGQYLNNLLLGLPIKSYRTTIDLGSLSCQSEHITKANIARYKK